MTKKATLLWVDLEMTGLEPSVDRIVEVAAIATDWQLNPLSEFKMAVKVDLDFMKQRMVGDFWDANDESRQGLMSASQEGVSSAEVESRLLAWIDENFAKDAIAHNPKYANKIILAGNSIHQDRKFIDNEWPRLAKRLHYRMLDVSAWKLYFEGAKGEYFTKRESHRAMDDILGSIEELKWYTTFMKGQNEN